MKISEILWLAANEKLWSGIGLDNDTSMFSCNAVFQACEGYRKAYQFLKSLGCPIKSLHAYPAKWTHEKRQGARYLWLMFAFPGEAAVAADQPQQEQG